MDRLLFTFSNQQLSQQIVPSGQGDRQLTEFLISYQEKREVGLRAFRSKKMKRYEQYLEATPVDDSCFSPPKNPQTPTLPATSIDHDLRNLIKPHSTKHSELTLRPKVSTNSRHFPPDFNAKAKMEPRSMQLIRQESENDEKPSLKKKMREEIQTATKRRLSTSKDAPKIHFPVSDKKLPQVFRMRSISHDRVNSIAERRKAAHLVTHSEPKIQNTPSRNEKSKKMYINFARVTEVTNTEPTRAQSGARRRKVESFCLNAEETPRFKPAMG